MTLAIVGRIGSGKTYAAKSMVEGALSIAERVCIVDPTGAWWGLRLWADGSGPAYPVVIFGGEHADVPLAHDQGEMAADAIVDGRAPQSVIDVSEMSGGEQTRFLTAFFERLYTKNRAPLMLVLDEADMMAPQNPMPDQRRLQGATNKLVRRGRSRGFSTTMITQRPQVIDKSVLSQIETLIAMRLTSPNDRKAIEIWVKGNAADEQAREVLDSLASLKRGDGWFWAPHDNILERRTFPEIKTFDSSRAPGAGEPALVVEPLRRADIEGLRADFTPPPEPEKPTSKNDRAGDAALRAEVHRLGQEIIKARDQSFAEGVAAGRKQVIALIRDAATDLMSTLDRLESGDSAATLVALAPRQPTVSLLSAAAAPPRDFDPERARAEMPPIKRRHAVGDDSLTGPQRQFLKAMAWWEAMGHPSPSRAQVAAIAGWRLTSSHPGAVAGSLSRDGLITYPQSGFIALTPAGRSAAPMPETGVTLHEVLRRMLTGPQRQMFDVLLKAKRPMARDDVAAACGWSTTSSHPGAVIGSLSALELVEYPKPGLLALQSWVTG